jgi:pimeloyl-ACP methyl ester carboxylesterase
MVAVSVALLAGCAGRPQEVAGPVLTPCGLAAPTGSDLQVRCAELAVPEAADQTAGPSLQLHVVVVRSSTAAERRPAPDPVVALAPSAGQAASAVPLGLATLVRLTLVRDLVLVDQRGTGGSHPLQCPNMDPQTLLAGPRRVAWLRACGAQLDRDVREFTTPAAVADLEQVRRLLGYERWNLYGPGYGSRVALGYAAAYPERVRTLLLDGAEPPDGGAGANQAALASGALDATLVACGQVPGCARAFPDLRDHTSRLLADLDAQQPAVSLPHPSAGIPVSVVLSSARVLEASLFLSADPIGAALLPWLLDRASGADLAPLAAQLERLAWARQSTSWGATFAIRCAEDVPRAGSAAGADELAICGGWPSAAAALEPSPVRVDVPTLLLAAAGDVVASPVTAQRLAANLSRSRVLVLPTARRIPGGNDCPARLAAAFVELGTADGLDTTCLASVPAPRFVISDAGLER